MKRELLISILDLLGKDGEGRRFMNMESIVDLICFQNGPKLFFCRFNSQTLSFIEKAPLCSQQQSKAPKQSSEHFSQTSLPRPFRDDSLFPLFDGWSEMLRTLNNITYQSLFRNPLIQQLTYLMEKVIQILKEHEALQHSSLQEKDIVIIEKRPGFADPVERRKKFVQGIISQQVPEEKFNAIMQKIDQSEIAADISQSLPPNSPFGDYGEIDNVLDQGKTHLKHKEGEVLLVDVWATWCGPCQKPMQHNQEMLEKNEAAWSGKARIVAVSVDDKKESVVTRVNTKGWTKIEHLTLLGWKGEHKLIKDFAISGIPFVCLVDKWGKINFSGHPSSINLEERINQLIAQENPSQAAPGGEKEKEAQAAPQANLSAILNKDYIKQEFSTNELLCIKGECITTLSNSKTTQKSILQVFAFQDDKEATEKARKLYQGVGAQVKLHEVKAVKVPHPQNPTCWQCNTPLQFPYYWLYWEENGPRFGCVGCIEKKSEQPNHHFFYEKNAVLLLGKWDRISLKNLGHNHQPTDYTTAQGHGFGCNGCGGNSNLGQARYICLGCRAQPNFRGDYVDLCEGCRAKIQTQEMKQQFKNENHHENHPLLRVLYGVKGYYEY